MGRCWIPAHAALGGQILLLSRAVRIYHFPICIKIKFSKSKLNLQFISQLLRHMVFKASRLPAFSFPLAPAPGLDPDPGVTSPGAIEDYDKLRPGSEIL